MNNNEITALALKVFAIYLIAETIIIMPSLYGILISVSEWVSISGKQAYIIPIILFFSIFIVVFILARVIWSLANDIINRANSAINIESNNVSSDFHEFMLFLLGVYISSNSLIRLTSPLSSAIVELSNPANIKGLSVSTTVWLISETLLLLIGISLILKRKGWKNLYYKLRTAGTIK